MLLLAGMYYLCERIFTNLFGMYNNEITERQQQIIRVSLDLIAEGGIQSLTIKNLSKKIGFAESAIYRHYENKIQILIAILDFFKQNSQAFFTKELDSNETAIHKIDNLFLSHFVKFSENPSLVAVIFSEEIFRNEAALTARVAEIMKENIGVLTTIVEKGQLDGEIRQDIGAGDLSVIIMGSLRMFVKQWHISNNGFDLMEKGKGLIKSINTLVKA